MLLFPPVHRSQKNKNCVYRLRLWPTPRVETCDDHPVMLYLVLKDHAKANMLQAITVQGHQHKSSKAFVFICNYSRLFFFFFSLSLGLCFSLRLWRQAVLRKIDYRPDPQFSLLLRLFSSNRCLFSSRRRASSSSWSCRHLWKFSTTTPTNMFSTKKLTISRKEMK